jgi:uncharacterized membrane protein
MAIRNPIEWTADKIGLVGGERRPAHRYSRSTVAPQPLSIHRIGLDDIRDALAKGWDDFGASRADVAFLCLFYPVMGLVFARLASGHDMLPLVFPLTSGFALLGPLAGVGLYEVSRRREQGLPTSWATAFKVAQSPSFGSIILLGLLLFVIYFSWLLTAWGIYAVTLGPQPPVSTGSFLSDVFTTAQGWTMIVVGIAVGFVYACIVLVLTSVSFPMLLDRNVTLGTAIATSIKVVRANLIPMAAWGLVIAVGLAIGSIPLFIGLIVVLPLLGHATWHLYRKAVSV